MNMAVQKPQDRMYVLRTKEKSIDPDVPRQEVFILNSSKGKERKEIFVYQNHPRMTILFRHNAFNICREPDFINPRKRLYLNACIRRIYLVNGLARRLNWAPAINVWPRREIWSMLNQCLEPIPVTPRRAALLRCKRQLFRKERTTSRKQAKPIHIEPYGTQVLNFRSLRQKIVPRRRSIRRGYLRPAWKIVAKQLVREFYERNCMHPVQRSTGFQRDYNDDEYKDVDDADAVVGVYTRKAHIFSQICLYHQESAKHQRKLWPKMSANQFTERRTQASALRQRALHLEAIFINEQIRHSLQTHQFIHEESMRSRWLSKNLLRLMDDHEQYVREDNRIMGRNK